jgi:hypothetical protein
MALMADYENGMGLAVLANEMKVALDYGAGCVDQDETRLNKFTAQTVRYSMGSQDDHA